MLIWTLLINMILQVFKFKFASSSQANEETDTLLPDDQAKNIASTTIKPDQTSTKMRLVLLISYPTRSIINCG